MVEEPDTNKCGRSGIGEVGFAFKLECLRSDFPWIRRDAVDDFQTVAIGFVLLPTAEAVEDGREEKVQHKNNQKEKREGGPIVGRTYVKRRAPACDRP